LCRTEFKTEFKNNVQDNQSDVTGLTDNSQAYLQNQKSSLQREGLSVSARRDRPVRQAAWPKRNRLSAL
jgi:hypothetical protein